METPPPLPPSIPTDPSAPQQPQTIVVPEQYQVDSAGRLLQSVPCRQCGYDLVTLRVDVPCPECGQPVWKSLRRDLLDGADPIYVRRIATGARFAEISSVGYLVIWVLVMLATIIMEQVFPASAAPTSPPVAGTTAAPAGRPVEAILGLAYMAAFGICSIVALVGWLKLTTAPTHTPGDDPLRTIRTFIRLAMLGMSSPLLFVAFGCFAGLVGPALLPLFILGGYIGVFVALACTIVFYFASLVFIRRLCELLPDAKLAAHAKRLLWLGPVLVFPGCVTVVGPLIGWGLYVLCIHRFAKSIRAIVQRQAERDARRMTPPSATLTMP